MSKNLADKYRPNRILKVKELALTFEITPSASSVYLRRSGSLQKVPSLLTPKKLLINYDGQEIHVGHWNEETDNFDYSLPRQKTDETD